ncbi:MULTISPECIES: hypothetical protein [Burkholderia]|uniref:hypothetical protein n=1 Tax=Burkholderia TaxID=32008 RepID=UPI00159F6575|nr:MULTISPECIES: hypothetical protein [Burkholderia]MBJ9681756.1 hypothetical protein [Burkholderia multivorans]
MPYRLVDARIDRPEGHATIGKGGAPSPPANLVMNLPRPVCATAGRPVSPRARYVTVPFFSASIHRIAARRLGRRNFGTALGCPTPAWL